MVLCKNCRKACFDAPDLVENIILCPETGHKRHVEIDRFCNRFEQVTVEKSLFLVIDPTPFDLYQHEPGFYPEPKEILKAAIIEVFSNQTKAKNYADNLGFDVYEVRTVL